MIKDWRVSHMRATLEGWFELKFEQVQAMGTSFAGASLVSSLEL